MVQVGPSDLVVDGEERVRLCASLFPFRIPRELWATRLVQVRATGYDLLDVYVPWNLHETAPGVWDLSDGRRDVGAFLDLAHEAGLQVLARPGPYICSEWDGGALPAWLTLDPELRVRQAEPRYLAQVRRWFGQVLPVLASRQHGEHATAGTGGAVVAAQLENELDFLDCDDRPGYVGALAAMAREHGITVPLVACAGQGDLPGPPAASRASSPPSTPTPTTPRPTSSPSCAATPTCSPGAASRSSSPRRTGSTRRCGGCSSAGRRSSPHTCRRPGTTSGGPRRWATGATRPPSRPMTTTSAGTSPRSASSARRTSTRGCCPPSPGPSVRRWRARRRAPSTRPTSRSRRRCPPAPRRRCCAWTAAGRCWACRTSATPRGRRRCGAQAATTSFWICPRGPARSCCATCRWRGGVCRGCSAWPPPTSWAPAPTGSGWRPPSRAPWSWRAATATSRRPRWRPPRLERVRSTPTRQ